MGIKTIPDEFIDAVWSRMAQNPQHTFLILTKRPRRMLEFVTNIAVFNYGILPNVWLGCTICNQQEWDKHKDIFLSVPGKKFISHEPALDRIDYGEGLKEISVLISGAETGAGARVTYPDTFRADRAQCEFYGVKFFLKYSNKRDGRMLDGVTHDDLPWLEKII